MATTKTSKRAARMQTITADEMHDTIAEIVGGMSTADLLAIPGIYEVLAEELNNEAIDLILESEGLGEDADDKPDNVGACPVCGDLMEIGDEDESERACDACAAKTPT